MKISPKRLYLRLNSIAHACINHPKWHRNTDHVKFSSAHLWLFKVLIFNLHNSLGGNKIAHMRSEFECAF